MDYPIWYTVAMLVCSIVINAEVVENRQTKERENTVLACRKLPALAHKQAYGRVDQSETS